MIAVYCIIQWTITGVFINNFVICEATTCCHCNVQRTPEFLGVNQSPTLARLKFQSRYEGLNSAVGTFRSSDPTDPYQKEALPLECDQQTS